MFEGPNDVLYEQYARGAMKAAGTTDVAGVLREAGFTGRSCAVAGLIDTSFMPTKQREVGLLGSIPGLANAVRWVMEGEGRFASREQDLVKRVGEEKIAAGLATLRVRCA